MQRKLNGYLTTSKTGVGGLSRPSGSRHWMLTVNPARATGNTLLRVFTFFLVGMEKEMKEIQKTRK